MGNVIETIDNESVNIRVRLKPQPNAKDGNGNPIILTPKDRCISDVSLQINRDDNIEGRSFELTRDIKTGDLPDNWTAQDGDDFWTLLMKLFDDASTASGV